LKQLIII